MRVVAGLLIASAGACGGGGPTTVVVTTQDVPASFAAYREGAGEWQTPEANGAAYTLHVSGDYQAVFTCLDADGNANTKVVAATAEDSDSWRLAWGIGTGFCETAATSDPPPPTTVHVTASVAQPGDVTLYANGFSDTGPWTFADDVPPGMHDLIATDDAAVPNLVVRRGLDLEADTALPAIDTASEGTPMVPASLDILPALSPTSLVWIDFGTANGGGFVSVNTPAKTFVPPPSLIQPGDLEWVSIGDTHTGRNAFVRVGQAGSTVPPIRLIQIPDVVYAGPTVAFAGALPDFGFASFALSAGSHGAMQELTATRAWIDATAATRLAIDIDAPGYDAAWKVDTASWNYTRQFELSSSSDQIDLWSIDSANVTPTP